MPTVPRAGCNGCSRWSRRRGYAPSSRRLSLSSTGRRMSDYGASTSRRPGGPSPARRSRRGRATSASPHRAHARQSIRDLRPRYSEARCRSSRSAPCPTRRCAATSCTMRCITLRSAIRDGLPDDIASELIEERRCAVCRARRLAARRGVLASAFPALRGWFAATEPARRAGVVKVHAEVEGSLSSHIGAGFRLTARADRIDVADDGSVVIYDYKTGRPPLDQACRDAVRPQLPLEAAIAEGGGFAALGARAVTRLALYPGVRAPRRRRGAARRRRRIRQPRDEGARGDLAKLDRALRSRRHALRGQAPARRRPSPASIAMTNMRSSPASRNG